MTKFFICLAALLTTFAAKAQTTFTSGDIIYKVLSAADVAVGDGENLAWTGAPEPEEITIPATVTYGGTTYTVSEIAAQAFKSMETVKTVKFPATGNQITAIGKSAFAYCKKLQNINLEVCTNLTTLGAEAFMQSFRTAGNYSVKIPQNVVVIPEAAFSNCLYLKEVEFLGDITSIGDDAFVFTGITSVILPASIKSIGNNAFYNWQTSSFTLTCNALKAPSIGSSILANNDDNDNTLIVPDCGLGYSDWADYFDQITGGINITSTTFSGTYTKEYDGTAILTYNEDERPTYTYTNGDGTEFSVTATKVTFLDELGNPSPSSGAGKKVQVSYDLLQTTAPAAGTEACPAAADNVITLENTVRGSITYTEDVYISANDNNSKTFYVGVHDDLDVLTEFSPELPSDGTVTVTYQYDDFNEEASYVVIVNNAANKKYVLTSDDGAIVINIHVAVPYVELSSDGKTLTFKYGEKNNGAMNLNEGEVPKWSGNSSTVTEVVFDKSFQYARPTSCVRWFTGFNQIETITDLKYLNTEMVTNMQMMFYNCTALKTLDLSNFNTENVTDMQFMFYGCENLNVLDIRSFDTKKVKIMTDMFTSCSNLKTILVSDKWSVNSVTKSEGMFRYCSGLIGNDGARVSTVDVTHANADAGGYLTKDDYKIFYKWADDKTGAYQTQYYPSSFNGESVVNIDNPSDREYPFLYWTQVSASGEQIGGSSTTLSIPAGDVGNKIYVMHWEVPQPYAELSGDGATLTFKYGIKPDGTYEPDEWTTQTIGSKDVDVLGWYIQHESITRVEFDETFAEARPLSCYNWFYGLTNLETISGINNLNTSEVSSMRGMFDKCKSLESVDLSHFTTNNLTNIRAMFCDCEKLSALDLRTFNTGEVTEAQYMFQNCTNLTSILVDDGKWDLSKVTASGNHKGMFDKCTALIGDKGTKFDSSKPINKTYAHVDEGESNPGYLTSGKYKIFYDLDADDGVDQLETYTGAIEEYFDEKVTLETPPSKPGYAFDYWTGTTITGLVGDKTAASVTIAKGEAGNRIYTAHWKVIPYSITLPDDFAAKDASDNDITTATIGQKVTITYSGTKYVQKIAVFPMPKSISITPVATPLNVNEKKTLTCTIEPTDIADEDKVVTWTSSDISVVKVVGLNTGEVEAVGSGNATITVETTNGKQATIYITVN